MGTACSVYQYVFLRNLPCRTIQCDDLQCQAILLYYKISLFLGMPGRRGNILIDLRLHDAITHARNHGTGFRAKDDSLD